MKVVVIGTGYVGLVTGTCLAESGHDVMCVDIDEQKVAKLKRGEVPIYEPGLADLVLKNHQAGRLRFTIDLSEIDQPAAIFFALPTPPGGDGQADLSFVLKAAEDVAKVIKKPTVLINKSTVPVGTAKKVHAVVVAHTSVPFDVVSNPEFLREGFAVDDFMHADRIVIGTLSERARRVMEELYQPFISTGTPLIVMDEASAEMTKYAANTFVAMKISFINEIANLCERLGADVTMVREGIGADDRIGRRYLHAGIGYGGSCFPKDVLALQKMAQLSDYDFKLVTAVLDVNARQRHLFVQKVTDHYGEILTGKTFAVWGLAFKADTDDIREAPALDIIRELLGRGAAIQAYDPEAAENVRRLLGDAITYAPSAKAALHGANALLLITEWKEFLTVSPSELARELQDKMVFDGRNVFTPEDMRHAGLVYIGVGRKPVADA